MPNSWIDKYTGCWIYKVQEERTIVNLAKDQLIS